MAGIAGIHWPGRSELVQRMLDRMAHRGGAGRQIHESGSATLGIVRAKADDETTTISPAGVRDSAGAGHYAEARLVGLALVLERDAVGAAPLYYGQTDDGHLCFASEVKALLEATGDLHELPPGARYDGLHTQICCTLDERQASDAPATQQIRTLRALLESTVRKYARREEIGCWLSGGLDSGAIAALARPAVRQLHTVTAGLPGAADLEYARQAARFIGSRHHEVVVEPQTLPTILPKVIYHLESFDAPLVRSSLMNYLAAERIAQYVPQVLSGEGGDELFAGYAYLKGLDRRELAHELLDILARLHNTALQRVDRCAAAYGLVVHVPLLDPQVVEHALRIPVSLKLKDGLEKWILRQAMCGLLPESIRNRPKAKFWEGAGVQDLLLEHAEKQVTDADFERERCLNNGWILNSKEELMYYRIFREYFGNVRDLAWVGRTKADGTWEKSRITGCTAQCRQA